MSGTLTAEQVRECVQVVYFEGYSDGSVNRGRHLEETNWQAIADELNARAERMCRIKSSYLNNFTSNHECWYELEMECGYRFTWDEMEPPNCCPNCGAKVRTNER